MLIGVLVLVVGYGILTALIGAYIGSEVILAIDESIVGKIIFFMIPIGLVLSFMSKKDKKDGLYEPAKKDIIFTLPIVTFVIGFYDGFLARSWILVNSSFALFDSYATY